MNKSFNVIGVFESQGGAFESEISPHDYRRT